QKEFMEIKRKNKVRLAEYIKEHNGIEVDPDSIFDVQVKRLHEYKRQFLNILHVMYLYNELKANPQMDFYPRTFIFGAKAAAGYRNAKLTIKLINSVADVINNDPVVDGRIKVVFIENYRVSNAEWIFAAADVSEQISTASKEASGTGNMKFMLNGALTLGTMDGANVEICQQVGDENIYIFGQTSDQVIHRYEMGDYQASQWVEGDPNIRRAVDFLVGPEMLAAGHEENLRRLHDELVWKDWFQTLPDFNAYVVRKGQALSDYACDPLGWRKKCVINIAKAGLFSSDRTIAEYNKDIWHLGE
uniref:glycogen/starch/alpha-glucan phosphorylase n=2 Tax=Gemmiger formicilis TaxID=745368 RepID=UPI0040266144